MPATIIKETIELEDILLDADGNAFIQKELICRKDIGTH